MSDSDRIQLSYAKEETYGTPPATAYQIMRATSESLHQETSVITSAELRADRQIPDVVRSNLSAAGDISTELSYSFEDFFESGLMSAGWSTQIPFVSDTGTEISMDEDGGTAAGDARITFASTRDLSGVSVGMWLKTSGFAASANNGYFKITAVDDENDRIDIATGGRTLVDSAAPETTVTLKAGAQIVNGTTQSSYTIEKKYTDLSTNFAHYYGMMVDSMSLNVSTESMVTGGFTFIGSKALSNTATHSTADPAYTDATTKDVMNSIDDVTGVMESTAYTHSNITAFSLNIANNLRPRLQVGTLGAVSIGTGTCNVTGTLQAYYNDKALFDISWEAVMDDTEGITVRVIKFDA
jgi:hypothetical protein